MQNYDKSVLFLLPENTSELLSLRKKHPEAVIYSGGTEITLKSNTKHLQFPPVVLYTGYIDELKKMKKTERYLEIGACTAINKIIDKGKRVIPEILLKSLESVNPPNFRNITTIGGFICSSTNRNSVFTVLAILDARLEIRSAASSRWIGINQLFSEGILTLAPDEILLRIRIFLKDYTYNFYREVENSNVSEEKITFSALVNSPKDNISFMKFVFSISSSEIIRDKEIESELVGLGLPLNRKTMDITINHFSDRLSKKYKNISDYQKYIVLNLFRWFLMKINYY